MTTLLWLVVLLPFLGALVLALTSAWLPKKAAGVIGCATVGAPEWVTRTRQGREEGVSPVAKKRRNLDIWSRVGAAGHPV
jgi:hypothetical protein